MTDSFRLGRILGIPVGIHWGALLIAALFAVSLATTGLLSFATEASLTLRLGVASAGVVVFFASILAHEIGHALVALSHGIEVNGITLWVLGGMARLEREPTTARSEFQIAVAGPAVSLALGLFFGSLAMIAFSVSSSQLAVVILSWLCGVNVMLGVFNLLPAAPLDGGRILAATLWHRSGDPNRARLVAGRSGLVLSLGLVLAGVYLLIFNNPINGATNIAIGALVYFAAAAEISSAAIQTRLAATTVGEIHTPNPAAVGDSTTMGQLLAVAGIEGTSTAFPVVRWDRHPIGYVVPDWVGHLPAPEQSWTTVGGVMIRPEDTTSATTSEPIADVVARLGRDRAVFVTSDPRTRTPVGTLTDGQIRPLLATPTLWGNDRRPKAELPQTGAAPASP
ncbi:MAG: site-2 protease family protein [Actinomycetia bacterium]|nr:site-2 protease family protein [Actinomycetes bacterium]MCP4226267.1 site-2 protease family protein [Actinomycetes bacterium]MCP5032130.1 site-2 protease family protein [Actinomycetes bacterium]